MSGYRVAASRVFPVEQSTAFDRLMGARLPDLFSRRYAAFPPVQEVVDEPADWGNAGQSRVIRLADGGSLRETLTSVDRPHGFAYLLDDLHGRLRPFLHTVDGLVRHRGGHWLAGHVVLDDASDGLAGAADPQRDRSDVERVRRTRP